MRKAILLVLFTVSFLADHAQTDSLKYAALDSLTSEQLLDYYVNEPPPPQTWKGPLIGDTLYARLDSLAMGTKTVALESRYSDLSTEADAGQFYFDYQDLRPMISIGTGMMAFSGDLHRKGFRSPLHGKPGIDLVISHRFSNYLQIDFNVLFGKLSGNEAIGNRHENFMSEIRAGGVNFVYDFGNFIQPAYKIRPFLSLGAYGFEFLSKTDLKDLDGNAYHYWSDGSIRDRAEFGPDAYKARELVRDYRYESDIRELNRDNFGKYQERAWAFPVGIGFIARVTDRINMKVNYQHFFTTTDYIDGLTENSVPGRTGTKKNDNFSYTSVSIQYDLVAKFNKRRPMRDTTSDAYYLAEGNEDTDRDSVPDFSDKCPGTPTNIAVDASGCPTDGDGDGVPDFRDDELTTPAGVAVNAKGVALDDAYWKRWHDNYLNDTLATDKITEYVGSLYFAGPKQEERKDNYTVELMRYTGSIPSDELAFLLSIGDINSTTLEDGTTVVYTTGNYDKLMPAIKRRDEFRKEGNKKAGVSQFKERDVVQLPEEDLESMLSSELEDLLKINVNDSAGVDSNAAAIPAEEDQIVYRVQLGAFKNRISTSVFNTKAGVVELQTGESVYRYVTKGYPTIEEAAAVRADLVVQGYSDAFVTAYKGGKRVPMNETKATVEADYKEDMNENKVFSSIDRSLLAFKIQLGPRKKKAQEEAVDERVKELPDHEKQTTASGSIRYTSGRFSSFDEAEKYRKELEAKGITDAFIIATFKEEIISLQEAMELLK